jgi:hypothetical protein
VLTVDWLRLTPYASTGTFTSRILDGGSTVTWNTATWTADLPAGTAAVVSVRTGNTASPDSSWTGFTTVPTSGAVVGASARYLQYRVTFTTSTPGQSPALRDLTVGYGA